MLRYPVLARDYLADYLYRRYRRASASARNHALFGLFECALASSAV